MRPGIDCAFAGTTADFDQAAEAGIEWVGEYFGGDGCFHVWTNNDRAALATSKVPYRLPIWVPAQSFGSNPVDEATEALAAHKALGFKSVLAVDVESNSGYTLAWGESFSNTLAGKGIIPVLYHGNDKPLASGFQGDWLAFWTGNPPSKLNPKSAVQYRGATSSYGMSVDFDMASDDFPLEGLPAITNQEGTRTVDTLKLPRGKLRAPITCSASTSDRHGGWLIGADGGVFCWGSAGFFGSIPGRFPKAVLAAPIIAIEVASDDKGYTLIGSDGGTFPFGSGPNMPSLA